MPVEVLPVFTGSTVVIIVQREGFLNSLPLLYKGNKDQYNHQIHFLMYEHRGYKEAGGFLIKLLASGQSLFDVYLFNPFKNCTPEHNLRTKHFIPSVIRTVYFFALTFKNNRATRHPVPHG